MFFLRLHSRIKDKILRIINKRTWRKEQTTFISAIDLMIPVDGIITTGQIVVISRMLDIERIRLGKKSIWDIRQAELRVGQLNEREKVLFNKQSELIVNSLDKYGWDYNLSSIIVNRVPFLIYNGTHRLAYSLLKNPYQMVPITINNEGWSWAKLEGIPYFQKQGLEENEIKILKDTYNALLRKYKIDNSLFVPYDIFRSNHKLQDKIQQLGRISKISHINTNNASIPKWFNNKEKKFFAKHQNIVAISLDMPIKQLFYKKGFWGSQIMIQAMKQIKIKRYIFLPTITRTIEFNIWLGNNTQSIQEVSYNGN